MLADGFSCRTQLAVGRTGREGWHLAQFLLVTSYVGGSLAAGLITVFIACCSACCGSRSRSPGATDRAAPDSGIVRPGMGESALTNRSRSALR